MLSNFVLPFDGFYYLAYLALALFRLNSIPALLATLVCALIYEFTLNLPPPIYYIFSSIVFSCVTLYYYRCKERCWIVCPIAAITTFLMGSKVLLDAIGWEQVYYTLYDSYKVIISLVHILICVLLIRWRRLLSILVKCFNAFSTKFAGIN